MGIDSSLGLDPNPKLTRNFSILIHRTQRVSTRRDTTTTPTTTRCSPSAAKVERTNICAGGGAAHKCALIGDALNN